MLIYFIYWLVLSFFSWIEVQISSIDTKRFLHKNLKIATFLGLIFIVGFRWETGSDWEPYLDLFKWTYSRGFFEPDSYMDYGYVLFNNICYAISQNYVFLLVVHAIIFYLILFKSFKIFTPNVILCVFLYTAMFFGMVGSNRQLLALVIGFYALITYLKGHYKSAIILLLLAISFHITAVFMLLYLVFNRKYKILYIIIFFLMAIIIGQSGIIESIFGFVGSASESGQGKVDEYTDASGAGTVLSVVGIARRAIMVILLLYFANSLRNKHKYFDLCLNAYLYTVAGFFLFVSVPILAGRGMLYFNIVEPILLIYLIGLLSSYKLSLIGYSGLFILIILYFFQAINLYPELFIPYKGVFINTNYFRFMT